jgi:O-acetyl-ADP-ribose deacetylase (regulator of RNase III)
MTACPCPAGHAVITPGFDLQARHVIHAVGPFWRGGKDDEDALLESCYAKSLALAGAAGLASIAFPCISTGAFGFPSERAARIAVDTVIRDAPSQPSLERVIFCCYGKPDAEVYREILGAGRT